MSSLYLISTVHVQSVSHLQSPYPDISTPLLSAYVQPLHIFTVNGQRVLCLYSTNPDIIPSLHAPILPITREFTILYQSPTRIPPLLYITSWNYTFPAQVHSVNHFSCLCPVRIPPLCPCLVRILYLIPLSNNITT